MFSNPLDQAMGKARKVLPNRERIVRVESVTFLTWFFRTDRMKKQNQSGVTSLTDCYGFSY